MIQKTHKPGSGRKPKIMVTVAGEEMSLADACRRFNKDYGCSYYALVEKMQTADFVFGKAGTP